MANKNRETKYKISASSPKVKAEGDGRTICGYAATFNAPPDSYNDVILPGAFTKTLNENWPPRSDKPKIKCCFNHNKDIVLGPVVELKADAIGLYYETEVVDTTFGNDILKLVKAGAIDSNSFSYSTIVEEFDREQNINFLKELELRELGPVTFAANPEAMTTGVKSERRPILIAVPASYLDIKSRKDEKRVMPFGDLPLAGRDRKWDAARANGRVRALTDSTDEPSADYRKAFFWFDTEAPDSFGSYKLPFADAVDGELVAVPSGIFAVAGVLQGSRGGVDIPESDQTKIKRVVDKYYAKMRGEFDDDSIVAPWKKDAPKDDPIDAVDDDTGDGLPGKSDDDGDLITLRDELKKINKKLKGER